MDYLLIHFNSRSLNANSEYLIEVVENLKTNFDIIAISESWMKTDKHAEYNIKGYDFLH